MLWFIRLPSNDGYILHLNPELSITVLPGFNKIVGRQIQEKPRSPKALLSVLLFRDNSSSLFQWTCKRTPGGEINESLLGHCESYSLAFIWGSFMCKAKSQADSMSFLVLLVGEGRAPRKPSYVHRLPHFTHILQFLPQWLLESGKVQSFTTMKTITDVSSEAFFLECKLWMPP